MKLMAEIDGWRKVLDIDTHLIHRGSVEVSFAPAPDVTPGGRVPENGCGAKVFRLVHYGNYINGLPLFEWR